MHGPEPLNSDVVKYMLDTNRALGRIEEGQKSIFIKVKEADSKLERHLLDIGAHGLKQKTDDEKALTRASDKKWERVATWIIALATLGTLLWDMKGRSAERVIIQSMGHSQEVRTQR